MNQLDKGEELTTLLFRVGHTMESVWKRGFMQEFGFGGGDDILTATLLFSPLCTQFLALKLC